MSEETKDELDKELSKNDEKAGSPDLSGTPEREKFKELYGTDGSAGQSEPTTPPTTGSAPATPPTT
jgi:hypothetical protein